MLGVAAVEDAFKLCVSSSSEAVGHVLLGLARFLGRGAGKRDALQDPSES